MQLYLSLEYYRPTSCNYPYPTTELPQAITPILLQNYLLQLLRSPTTELPPAIIISYYRHTSCNWLLLSPTTDLLPAITPISYYGPTSCNYSYLLLQNYFLQLLLREPVFSFKLLGKLINMFKTIQVYSLHIHYMCRTSQVTYVFRTHVLHVLKYRCNAHVEIQM